MMVHGSEPCVDRKRTNRASGETQMTPKSVIPRPFVRSFMVCMCQGEGEE